MSILRNTVLLTIGRPEFRHEDVHRRLERWTGLTFGRTKEDENCVVGQDPTWGVKIGGNTAMLVTLLGHPYWDTHPSTPYIGTVKTQGDDKLLKAMAGCKGAIIIDAQAAADGPTATVYLAKVTAACMGDDTPVVVVPPAVRVARMTNELRSTFGRSEDARELAPHLLGFHVMRLQRPGELLCTASGLQFFDLPDVTMICQEREVDRAIRAVQSVAMYQIRAGKALPMDDALAVQDLGDLRVIPSKTPPRKGQPYGAIGLIWE